MNILKRLMMNRIRLFFLLFTFQLTLNVGAQEEKKVYQTQKIPNESELIIDGVLNDQAWELMDWNDGFVQHMPYNGKDASQRTAFKILYDDNHIYVGIRAFDESPDSIVTRMSRRDETDGDEVSVFFDSYNDQLTAFYFCVSSAGVKFDAIFTENGENVDINWNPIWYVKTSIDNKGWCAEMKIPFTQLRFKNQDDMVWGLQVERFLLRNEEISHWQHIPQDSPGWVHLIGKLKGIEGIEPKRQIELAPYIVASTERYKEEVGNPFATGKGSDINVGLDGKIGISNNLTLDFSLNPDFGQVEADPSELNISAFESYFEEKRPFFIEGKNIFEFRMHRDQLFYSRRIGRSPHHSPDLDSAEYADEPLNTPILEAVKITGKTNSGWSMGILQSTTTEVRAEIDSLGNRSYETVEPFTNYLVGRIQKDINKGNTRIGAMFTNANRNIDVEHLNYLHTSAITGGLDFNHQWKDKTYYVNFKSLFSTVRGDEEAIYETQTSSARYFQRPDADYISVDSTRTSLSGTGGTLSMGKGGNGKLQYDASFSWKSPGLELNDIGFMNSTDEISQSVWIGYRIWEPFSIFRHLGVNFNQWQDWDFGSTRNISGININAFTQFKNFWRLGMSMNLNSEEISNSTLRGGSSIKLPGSIHYSFNMSSDNRKNLNAGIHIAKTWGKENFLTRMHYCSHINYKPSKAIKISIHPSFNNNEKLLQYVDQIDDRYIFATINRKTLNLSFRLNYSITPDLTIQYWGQPYISAGKYTEFKVITNPHANALTDRYHVYTQNEISSYTDEEGDVNYEVDEDTDGTADFEISNPDFNFREFRSNLVVRWEYIPGSTLYLVWSQNRSDEIAEGNLKYGDDLNQLFDTTPHNIFLLKFSYKFKN